jgi:HEPN domain-containing protein
MMTNEEKYEYWLDIAEYDLETASSMYNSGRWLYVLVMCQQAVEKLVKGLYTLYVDDNVPRIHNIRLLVEAFEDRLPVGVPPDKYDLFDRLSRYYLNNRYPEFISKLSLQIKKSESEAILTETKEAFAWLLTLKP